MNDSGPVPSVWPAVQFSVLAEMHPILRPMAQQSSVSQPVTGPQHELDAAFRRALEAAFGEPGRGFDPATRPSQSPKFGDYQANFAMGLAKQVGANPREIAMQVVAALDVSD